MQDKIEIGLIVKPQGIKGQLKLKTLTDDSSRFSKLKNVFIDGVSYRVAEAKAFGDTAFLTLFGVNDRNTAETFRGKYVLVERKDAVVPKEGRYFIVDVLGCTLFTDDGEKIGTIIDITSAHTDVITVDCGEKGIMRFPFLKDLEAKVDIQNKTFTVKAKRLGEVSCYEN